jgi:hypothetical protein
VFHDCDVDGQLTDHISEHSTAAAIRFGLCDRATAERAVEVLYEQRTLAYVECQPFYTAVVLQALDRLERFELALRLIDERWGQRMVDKGLSSCLEEWTNNGSWRTGRWGTVLRTQSHAWSAHPAEFLTRWLIGFEIVEPGCGKIRLQPRSVPFDYTVTYPTPRGDIRVTCQDGDLGIELPEGVERVK